MTTKIKKTCAVCFREISTHTDLHMVRHGFKVQGRKNGQHGCAWQTGGCAGDTFLHYGVSVAGTRYALEGVEKYLVTQEKRLAELATRPTLKYPIRKYNRSSCKHETVGHIDLNDGDESPGHFSDLPKHPGYAHVHYGAVRNVEKNIESARADVAFFQDKIAQWAPEAN